MAFRLTKALICAAVLWPSGAQADPIFTPIVLTSFTVGATTITVTASLALLAVGAAAIGGALYLVSALKQQVGLARQGTTIPDEGSNHPFKHLVGRGLVAGHVINRRISGNKNRYFTETRALGYGPWDAIEEVYINDEIAPLPAGPYGEDGVKPTSGKWKDGTWFSFGLGEAAEGVDPMLLKWGSADADARHQPFAYVVTRYDFETYQGRVAKTTFVARGRKVYDPRDLMQDPNDEASWAWSDNLALIAAWYVRQSWSFGALAAEIGDENLIAAANICDENVLTADGVTTEKRYVGGGVISEDDDRAQVLSSLCAAMAGDYSQPRIGGYWEFWAGAYQPPSIAFEPIDIVTRRSFSRESRSLKERYTKVGGNFQSQANRYQSAPYPSVRSISALAEEHGELAAWLGDNPSATSAAIEAEANKYRDLNKTLDLVYVQHAGQAQRVASILLEQSRLQVKWTGDLGYISIRARPGMTCTLTDDLRGLDEFPFKIRLRKIDRFDTPEGLGAMVELIEERAATYDPPTLRALTDGPAISLPGPDDPGETDDTPGGDTTISGVSIE